MIVERKGIVEVLGRRTSMGDDMEPQTLPCHVEVEAIVKENKLTSQKHDLWQARIKGALGWYTGATAANAILQAVGDGRLAARVDRGEAELPQWVEEAVATCTS